jgi:hypothetical protein
MLVKSVLEVTVDDSLVEVVEAELRKVDAEEEKELIERLWVDAKKDEEDERS